MSKIQLPAENEMHTAFETRDAAYDGIFFTAVRTTGIFCRPTCPARKPARSNVEFFATAREALANGYRPCKRCRPLEPSGQTPEPIRALLAEIEADPSLRLRDADLRARGLEPATTRRWFKTHHGMTFQAYHRARRLAAALNHLSNGQSVTDSAFDSGFESLSGFREALKRVTGQQASASRNATVVRLSRILTPLGPMIAGALPDGICLLEFTDRRMLETQLKRLQRRLKCTMVPGSNAHTLQLEEELAAYFEGQLEQFNTPLRLQGTAFQLSVWEALRQIPFGQTRSYGEQAASIGQPTAVRAVARANGDNAVAIVVPCHRVIGADGQLTGYGGGLWRKQRLLEIERVVLPNSAAIHKPAKQCPDEP